MRRRTPSSDAPRIAPLVPEWQTRRVQIHPSPWAGHDTDEVFVREIGSGTPILFLHGGWGYGVYPLDDVVRDVVPGGFRLIVPDRVGYGRSSPLEHQPPDFHRRYATETRLLLDALGLETCILWGHSDGAVIAIWMALETPARFPGMILEAMHYWQNKPASTPFFEGVADGTMELNARTNEALEKDHGPRWKDLVRMNAAAWVGLAKAAKPGADLYRGALSKLSTPTLFLHGRHDPRTEPGELEAAAKALRGSKTVLVEGKHAPHAEPRAWAQGRESVSAFLSKARKDADGSSSRKDG